MASTTEKVDISLFFFTAMPHGPTTMNKKRLCATAANSPTKAPNGVFVSFFWFFVQRWMQWDLTTAMVLGPFCSWIPCHYDHFEEGGSCFLHFSAPACEPALCCVTQTGLMRVECTGNRRLLGPQTKQRPQDTRPQQPLPQWHRWRGQPRPSRALLSTAFQPSPND